MRGQGSVSNSRHCRPRPSLRTLGEIPSRSRAGLGCFAVPPPGARMKSCVTALCSLPRSCMPCPVTLFHEVPQYLAREKLPPLLRGLAISGAVCSAVVRAVLQPLEAGLEISCSVAGSPECHDQVVKITQQPPTQQTPMKVRAQNSADIGRVRQSLFGLRLATPAAAGRKEAGADS